MGENLQANIFFIVILTYSVIKPNTDSFLAFHVYFILLKIMANNDVLRKHARMVQHYRCSNHARQT